MTLAPKPRRICVVTGSRADYGHLQPVMTAINNDPALALQVIVCGQHLDPRFGETWHAVAADGFAIDGRVDLAMGEDTALAVAEATGRAVTGVARDLNRLAPDMVLVLGDRYEILAAGVAALLLHIPVAHIHGGEITEGAMDDAMRHALSKMAALHFVAAEPYRKRLIQMGEDPAGVIVSGAPGLDQIDAVAPMTAHTMTADLGIEMTGKLFLITYHPVTLRADGGVAGLSALLCALAAYPDAAMIFTGVNSDPGNRNLRDRIAAFVGADPRRHVAVKSLGQQLYVSAMKAASVVIGNSSSGLIEAPALHIPSVNIGDRQKGRLRSASVIDCGEDESAIRAAIERALDPAFRTTAAASPPAYGGGGAASRIVGALKAVPLTQLSSKRFHDIILPP